MHPVRRSILYASTYGSGIYKSFNGGASWGTVNLGLVNTKVRDVAMIFLLPIFFAFAGFSTDLKLIHASTLGPLFIVLHSALRLTTWVSIPFWSMTAVVLSGVPD